MYFDHVVSMLYPSVLQHNCKVLQILVSITSLKCFKMLMADTILITGQGKETNNYGYTDVIR